jgi:hypothetical protein
MMLGTKSALSASAAVLALALTRSNTAHAEIPVFDVQGWKLSTDGRVNTFLSVALGTGSEGPEDAAGTGTAYTVDTNNALHSTRIRNGFMTSILGFTLKKEVSPNFKVTTRIALWLNASGYFNKNVPGSIDPRELYEKFEGSWGSVLAGSDLNLFGRGGILVDADIMHEYGLGYPCAIKDTSGGACGMAGFGAPFPGYDAGVIYATPDLAGAQLSVGLYDPATIGHAQLDRAPLPRVEGEAKYAYKDLFRAFGSGFWQRLEGTIADPGTGRNKNIEAVGWGVQGGAMVSIGPIMLGGAAYQGAGFSPTTYLEEGKVAADPLAVLRKSHGFFGLGAVSISSIRLKLAGGMGVWHLDKTVNDSGPVNDAGAPTDPHLIKENLGATVGLYQTTGPVHFALEYFRAKHTWYDRGVASMTDPNMTARVETPTQTVNFINVGATVAW